MEMEVEEEIGWREGGVGRKEGMEEEEEIIRERQTIQEESWGCLVAPMKCWKKNATTAKPLH
jgi:hypothetical protein